jgi:hypothetical protein
MIKIQIIKLLALRGVTELFGETAGMAITRTGGEGTLEEMVKVNEQSMFHYIDKLKEQEAINKTLQNEIDRLHRLNAELEDDSLMLSCYRNAGVDNWGGAGDAEEMFAEIKGE